MLINVAKLIIQIGLLFGVYSIGAGIQRFFNSFIPGSVLGLILMFGLLATGIIKTNWIKQGARFMIDHLVLFFIPATVGLLNYYTLFKGKGSLLIFVTILSTLIVMVGSGWTSQLIARRRGISNE